METLLDNKPEVRSSIKNKESFYILVFKTNIRFKKDIKHINLFLNEHSQAFEWSVDIKDIDKVLRIKSVTSNPIHFINLINRAGYYCEELAD